MTRKHFAAIADAIALMGLSDADRRIVASAMATTVAQFNPHFNRSRFLTACGVL